MPSSATVFDGEVAKKGIIHLAMSSLGSTIAELRHQRHLTQRNLSQAAGLGVAYLSRLEGDRLVPSIRTLNKLAKVLQVPVSSFFATGPAGPTEKCPVSVSGRCVLDERFASRGRMGPRAGRYSAEHMRAMKLCDFLMHEGDAEARQTVLTMLGALIALAGKEVGP